MSTSIRSHQRKTKITKVLSVLILHSWMEIFQLGLRWTQKSQIVLVAKQFQIEGKSRLLYDIHKDKNCNQFKLNKTLYLEMSLILLPNTNIVCQKKTCKYYIKCNAVSARLIKLSSCNSHLLPAPLKNRSATQLDPHGDELHVSSAPYFNAHYL